MSDLISPKMFFSEMSLEEMHTYLKWKIAQEVLPRTELHDIPSDVALLGVKTDIEKLLPCGPEAPGNHFWRIETVLEEGMTPVGGLWFQHGGGKMGTLCGIDIFTMHRKKGYARGAMMELHGAARNMGVETLLLHVYPNNFDAMHLYDAMGYYGTNLFMRCKL